MNILVADLHEDRARIRKQIAGNGGGRPYINGNREESNNFLLDGVDDSQVSENAVGFTPSPDAIEEFNVITQNASAEFGNFQGGVVSASIKSGTNAFHGDVFEFIRNDAFNANSWSNGLQTPVLPKAKMRWNMFGGTVWGQALWSAGHGGDPEVYIAILEALVAAGATAASRVQRGSQPRA